MRVPRLYSQACLHAAFHPGVFWRPVIPRPEEQRVSKKACMFNYHRTLVFSSWGEGFLQFSLCWLFEACHGEKRLIFKDLAACSHSQVHGFQPNSALITDLTEELSVSSNTKCLVHCWNDI